MFYVLLIVALVAYSLNGSLLIRQARALDGFRVAMYRGLALIFIMMPVLFWAPKESYGQLFTLQNTGLLIVAGIGGYLANASSMQAAKHLPLGVLESINASGKALLYILVGLLIYRESLTPIQLALLAVLIVAAIALALAKDPVTKLRNPNLQTGISLLFLSILSAVTTISIMGYLAETINPFTVAYFWEVFIGLAGITILSSIKVVQKKPFPKVSKEEFWKIFRSCSPTLIGTGCFTYALSVGPISIGGAVMTGGIFITTILGWILYQEKPNIKQWLLILLIIVAIASLKLAGGTYM